MAGCRRDVEDLVVVNWIACMQKTSTKSSSRGGSIPDIVAALACCEAEHGDEVGGLNS